MTNQETPRTDAVLKNIRISVDALTLEQAQEVLITEMSKLRDLCFTIERELNAANKEIEKEVKSHGQTVDERDEAAQSFSQVYFLMTGRSPERSNNFGYLDAINELEMWINLKGRNSDRAIGRGEGEIPS